MESRLSLPDIIGAHRFIDVYGRLWTDGRLDEKMSSQLFNPDHPIIEDHALTIQGTIINLKDYRALDPLEGVKEFFITSGTIIILTNSGELSYSVIYNIDLKLLDKDIKNIVSVRLSYPRIKMLIIDNQGEWKRINDFDPVYNHQNLGNLIKVINDDASNSFTLANTKVYKIERDSYSKIRKLNNIVDIAMINDLDNSWLMMLDNQGQLFKFEASEDPFWTKPKKCENPLITEMNEVNQWIKLVNIFETDTENVVGLVNTIGEVMLVNISFMAYPIKVPSDLFVHPRIKGKRCAQ